MRDVYIIGVGMTQFGKHPNRSLRSLGFEACLNALRDASITPKEIEAGYCGNALAPAIQGETGVGQNTFWEVGINGDADCQYRKRLRLWINCTVGRLDGSSWGIL